MLRAMRNATRFASVSRSFAFTPETFGPTPRPRVFPLFAAFGALLVYPEDGAARVFAFMVTVAFSDIGGYAAGVLFGKHRMVPAISPKKSWEGLAGSLLCGVSAAVLAVVFLLHQPWWVGVPLGLMLVVTATLDFPNTVAGACSDLTVTVPGAVSGDVVALGVPAVSVPANGSYSAWISGPDTATVRYANNDLVTAYDPASGVFRVAVTRY